MNDDYEDERLANRLWEVLREFRNGGHHLKASALERGQAEFGEICSRFLAALLVDNPTWDAAYWFDGVVVDEFRPMEPHGIEIMGRVHFARGQEHWFTAPVYFALAAPPNARLTYRVLFDDTRYTSERDRARKNLGAPTQWRFEMVQQHGR